MAMKKAEMQEHYDVYHYSMERARALERRGLITRALQECRKAWPFIDGMMQFSKRYESQEFSSIPAIDMVLKHAPYLFDFESMEALEQLLKQGQRIEKNTSQSLADKLADARSRMELAHRLWNYLELNPGARQDRLRKALGGDQEVWRAIAETWEKMGLLSRVPEGGSYRLDFRSRMGAVVFGKCPECGSKHQAPKSMLLGRNKCPDCQQDVVMVLLPN